MNIDTASLTLDLQIQAAEGVEEQKSQWIHLTPIGKFTARDGRGPWRIADPDVVINNTAEYLGKNTMPVDYEHQIDNAAKNGQPAPAAGWIVGLKADAQGIWGLVNWTDKALAYIKAKEYKYISPVFNFHRENGNVTMLLRAALTNAPALELTALAKADESQTADAELTEIKALLGMSETASKDDLIANLKTLQQQANPAGYVPLGEFKRVESELNTVLKNAEEKTAVAKVESAIDAGEFPPSMRDWGVAMCRSDPDGFERFTAQVKILYGMLKTMQTSRLTAEERAFLNQQRKGSAHNEIYTALGLSQDDLTTYGANQ